MNDSFINIGLPGVTKLNIKVIAKENAVGVSAVQVSFKAEVPAAKISELIGLQAGGHIIQASFQAMQANFGKTYIEDVVDVSPELKSVAGVLHINDNGSIVDKATGEIVESPPTARQQAARDREARKKAAKAGSES